MDFEGFNLKRAALAGVVGVAALILMILVTGRMVHLRTAGRGKEGGAVSEETVTAGKNTGEKDGKEAKETTGSSVARDSAGNSDPGNKENGASESKDNSNHSSPGTTGPDNSNGNGNTAPNSST